MRIIVSCGFLRSPPLVWQGPCIMGWPSPELVFWVTKTLFVRCLARSSEKSFPLSACSSSTCRPSSIGLGTQASLQTTVGCPKLWLHLRVFGLYNPVRGLRFDRAPVKVLQIRLARVRSSKRVPWSISRMKLSLPLKTMLPVVAPSVDTFSLREWLAKSKLPVSP